MDKQSKKLVKQLADIIEANPNCKFNIDNDGWYITLPTPDGDEESPVIADSSDFDYSTDWYTNSGNYGAALSEAMIELLNRRGFDISAESV
jgi:hypothetical protein